MGHTLRPTGRDSSLSGNGLARASWGSVCYLSMHSVHLDRRWGPGVGRKPRKQFLMFGFSVWRKRGCMRTVLACWLWDAQVPESLCFCLSCQHACPVVVCCFSLGRIHPFLPSLLAGIKPASFSADLQRKQCQAPSPGSSQGAQPCRAMSLLTPGCRSHFLSSLPWHRATLGQRSLCPPVDRWPLQLPVLWRSPIPMAASCLQTTGGDLVTCIAGGTGLPRTN